MKKVLRVLCLTVVYFAFQPSYSSADVVDIAVSQIGKLYVEGGNGPNAFDCSGLTKYAFGQIGSNIPRRAIEQSQVGELVVGSLQRGDLLFFATVDDSPNTVTHVGIYEGDSVMIDANSYAKKVVRDDISTNYWTTRFLFAGRPPPPSIGKIIVDNDEWTLSDTGFGNAPDTGRFAVNVAALLASSPPANIHAYSNNFSFTGSYLATVLTTAGYTYTTGTNFPFTLDNISRFKALFLGGDYLTADQISTLIAYVNGGGNVYLTGGTGIGGAAVEAAAWNPFLNVFGLSFESFYNNVTGNIPVSGHVIFVGVSALYQNNGNSISGIGVVCCGSVGLYAVVETSVPTTNISVNNPSFEVLPAEGLPFIGYLGGTFSIAPIPGWVNAGDSGQFQPGINGGAYFNTLSNGPTVGDSNGGTISQTVGATVQAGVVYTLQVDVGLRNDACCQTFGTVQLLIGDTVIQATGSLPPQGFFSTFTAVYTGLPADVGKSITIQLSSTAQQGDFDNVQLTASSPK